MVMAVLEGIVMCFVLLIICVVGITDGPLMVYLVNGASDFKAAAIQMTVIYMISGLFDRIFIDWYWVGKTKAWIIPGTEEMRPYIYGKTLIGKWVSTLIGFPILAVIIAWVVSKI